MIAFSSNDLAELFDVMETELWLRLLSRCLKGTPDLSISGEVSEASDLKISEDRLLGEGNEYTSDRISR
jgi:3-deoxy-D-manno-octulosonic-acid transferase